MGRPMLDQDTIAYHVVRLKPAGCRCCVCQPSPSLPDYPFAPGMDLKSPTQLRKDEEDRVKRLVFDRKKREEHARRAQEFQQQFQSNRAPVEETANRRQGREEICGCLLI